MSRNTSTINERKLLEKVLKNSLELFELSKMLGLLESLRS